ncbi:MAG: hypothetical protein GC154_09995 [bacterium]|nr:hypothetical protein [bacterium]
MADPLFNAVFYYESPPRHVDAVFIDSLGEVDSAARAVSDGVADRVLIQQGPRPEYRDARPPISPHVFIEEELIAAGVPAGKIGHMRYMPYDIVEGHRLLREWLLSNQIHSYMVYAAPYNSRFKKITFDDTFAHLGVDIVVRPVEGRVIWRKQMLGMENLVLHYLWWKFVDLPKLRDEFGYGNENNTPDSTSSAVSTLDLN